MFGQVTIVTLPSGDKVRAKKPSLVTMFSAGLFPNDLTAHAIRLYNREIGTTPLAEREPGEVQSMFRLIDMFVPRVLVDPVVGDTTQVDLDGEVQTGTVRLEDIPDPDKQYLFLWGQHLLPDDASKLPTPEAPLPSAAEVAPFRDGDERAAAGQLGAAVSPAPVEPVEHPAGAPAGA